MAVHKIQITDFFTIDYELIAIQSNIEDYRLAFLLNRALDIRLSKNTSDIEVNHNEGKSAFQHFIYEDELQDLSWHLVTNKSNFSSNNTSSSLFKEINITMYLVPEFKQADYILKIDNTDDYFEIESILKKISEISNITLVHNINQDKLKSKNNLIF